MSELRLISPMLDGYEVGECAFDHSGVSCYPAMKKDSDKRYIVKKISLPASQVQVEALLLTGAYSSAQAARAYYEELAQEVRGEVQTLDKLASQRGFVPYKDCQIVPMEAGVGFDVYLLGRYRRTLERYLKRNPMTHLGAVNLGIDMCAALAVCREAGWLYVDLKPENIFLFGDQEYRIGDLGFVSMDSLSYASLPDRYRSVYTVPEVTDAYSSLNATMDTYALGLVLYQVYNEGKLPFSTAGERKAWLDRLAAGERVAAPACADEEMAGIIAKAIAYDPSERWQTPAEMGHALISYMQRNGADDVPILAPVVPEPEETVPETVEAVIAEAAGETPVEETPAEEVPAEETAAEEPAAEEASIEEVPAEEAPIEEVPPEEAPEVEPETEAAAEPEPVEAPAGEPEEAIEEALTELLLEEEPEEEVPETVEEAPAEEAPAGDAEVEAITADWIDLMDAILSEDAPEEDGEGAQPDAPSLRQLLEGGEALENADQLTAGDVSAETADMLSLAQELIEHEAPAPVVAPEPIDVPMPEPIVIELPGEETEAASEGKASEADPAESPAPVPVETKPRSGIWKKLLGTIAALSIAAGLGYGAWYYYNNYYLQPVSMTYDGTGTQVTVTVETALEHSKLTVICKDTYGNAVNGTLENGSVTFDDLVPGSQYIITLEADGFYKLVGQTSVTYSTPNETQVINLAAVTGQEDGSAIVSFGVEGADSEEWTLTYEAEGVEPQSVTFTGHTVTVPGLTVGTAYTFTLSAPEGINLVGETAITHTASALVQAQNVVLADYSDGVITVSWTAPEGVTVERWFVHCYNDAGYDQLLEVTGTTAAFEGITDGAVYTVEVTADRMTLGTRTEITAEASAISGFTATLNGSTIELSWNSTAASDVPWTIECSADGKVLQVITAEENKATFGPAAPGTSYTFTIRPINISADVPGGTATLDVPEGGAFSNFKLDSTTIIVEMFTEPTRDNWNYSTLQRANPTDTFDPGSTMALLYTVTKPYTMQGADQESVFVIRDADGKLVSASARTRTWTDMWNNGYCTETVSNLPTVPGAYSLTIYIAGAKLTQLNFTIE